MAFQGSNVAVAVDYSVPYKPIEVRRTVPAYPVSEQVVHDPSHYTVRAAAAVDKALERRYQAALRSTSMNPFRLVPRHLAARNDSSSTSSSTQAPNPAANATNASFRGRKKKTDPFVPLQFHRHSRATATAPATGGATPRSRASSQGSSDADHVFGQHRGRGTTPRSRSGGAGSSPAGGGAAADRPAEEPYATLHVGLVPKLKPTLYVLNVNPYHPLVSYDASTKTSAEMEQEYMRALQRERDGVPESELTGAALRLSRVIDFEARRRARQAAGLTPRRPAQTGRRRGNRMSPGTSLQSRRVVRGPGSAALRFLRAGTRTPRRRRHSQGSSTTGSGFGATAGHKSVFNMTVGEHRRRKSAATSTALPSAPSTVASTPQTPSAVPPRGGPRRHAHRGRQPTTPGAPLSARGSQEKPSLRDRMLALSAAARRPPFEKAASDARSGAVGTSTNRTGSSDDNSTTTHSSSGSDSSDNSDSDGDGRTGNGNRRRRRRRHGHGASRLKYTPSGTGWRARPRPESIRKYTQDKRFTYDAAASVDRARRQHARAAAVSAAAIRKSEALVQRAGDSVATRTPPAPRAGAAQRPHTAHAGSMKHAGFAPHGTVTGDDAVRVGKQRRASAVSRTPSLLEAWEAMQEHEQPPPSSPSPPPASPLRPSPPPRGAASPASPATARRGASPLVEQPAPRHRMPAHRAARAAAAASAAASGRRQSRTTPLPVSPGGTAQPGSSTVTFRFHGSPTPNPSQSDRRTSFSTATATEATSASSGSRRPRVSVSRDASAFSGSAADAGGGSSAHAFAASTSSGHHDGGHDNDAATAPRSPIDTAEYLGQVVLRDTVKGRVFHPRQGATPLPSVLTSFVEPTELELVPRPPSFASSRTRNRRLRSGASQSSARRGASSSGSMSRSRRSSVTSHMSDGASTASAAIAASHQRFDPFAPGAKVVHGEQRGQEQPSAAWSVASSDGAAGAITRAPATARDGAASAAAAPADADVMDNVMDNVMDEVRASVPGAFGNRTRSRVGGSSGGGGTQRQEAAALRRGRTVQQEQAACEARLDAYMQELAAFGHSWRSNATSSMAWSALPEEVQQVDAAGIKQGSSGIATELFVKDDERISLVTGISVASVTRPGGVAPSTTPVLDDYHRQLAAASPSPDHGSTSPPSSSPPAPRTDAAANTASVLTPVAEVSDGGTTEDEAAAAHGAPPSPQTAATSVVATAQSSSSPAPSPSPLTTQPPQPSEDARAATSRSSLRSQSPHRVPSPHDVAARAVASVAVSVDQGAADGTVAAPFSPLPVVPVPKPQQTPASEQRAPGALAVPVHVAVPSLLLTPKRDVPAASQSPQASSKATRRRGKRRRKRGKGQRGRHHNGARQTRLLDRVVHSHARAHEQRHDRNDSLASDEDHLHAGLGRSSSDEDDSSMYGHQDATPGASLAMVVDDGGVAAGWGRGTPDLTGAPPPMLSSMARASSPSAVVNAGPRASTGAKAAARPPLGRGGSSFFSLEQD